MLESSCNAWHGRPFRKVVPSSSTECSKADSIKPCCQNGRGSWVLRSRLSHSMTCTHEPGRKNDMISKSMHVSLERKHPNKKDPRRSTPSPLVGPRHMHLDLRARVPTSLSRGREGVSTAVISITMRGTVPKREVRLKPRGSLAKCLLSPLRW